MTREPYSDARAVEMAIKTSAIISVSNTSVTSSLLREISNRMPTATGSLKRHI